MTIVNQLSCEYRFNPLGIDETAPRLSWKLQTDRRGARQTAYRILAASAVDRLNEQNADLWDSGRVETDQSTHVEYAGQPLSSRQRIYWSVTVWDEAGNASTGANAWFEMGLLTPQDWHAHWIGADVCGGPRSSLPAPYLRKGFTLPTGVKLARLYITALGLYECSINGRRVGNEVLAPGWTDYRKRIQYMTCDVTPLLKEGNNAMGAVLGDGWAVGHIGWAHRQQYVDRPRLLAQLEITLVNGEMLTIPTDSTWKYQFGAIASSDLLMGEDYDARLHLPNWDQPAFDDARWRVVEVFDSVDAALVATNGPVVKPIEELIPVSDPVDKSSINHRQFIFDLGQNMVGRVRFKGSAPAGTTIVLRFAEILNTDGSLYTTNLRSARANDYYTFASDDDVVWEPKFTFHGFRYVELRDYPGVVTRDTITGIVLHSDMQPTGEFECSNPLINQLQHNIVWGQKGNFVDVPTDCPQRDERLGWTGDIQMFLRTAAFNMDVAGFMTKWTKDVRDAQGEDGTIPAVVPRMNTSALADGGPAWSDAVVICPWTVYLCYGDKRILEANYETMGRFMNWLMRTSPRLIRCAPEYEGWHGFGDWLSINAKTPHDLIGTAFFAHDANLMAQIAAVLGKHDEATQYRQLFENIKAVFQARFLFGSSETLSSSEPSEAWKRLEALDRLTTGVLPAADYRQGKSSVLNTGLFAPTQTAYVLALHFDLLPDDMRPFAVAELIEDIEHRSMHLSTGFVGSPYLPHVLSSNDRYETAFALLNQTDWPSWLYAVTQGATTIWERWDGWTNERGFQTPEMNSFNHYAYGAIGDWLYCTVAGIEVDPVLPGYKHIVLRPQPGGSLTYARAAIETMYGKLVSEWHLKDGIFEYNIVIPPNTTATVTLPCSGEVVLNGEAVYGRKHSLVAGTHCFTVH
jgi:alpha-L-rhamnosidase